ncbi:hypothetical protein BV25DRAFT_1922799 [Artomyces pyxidatus]|uniref:Uncharacterized protein n=1 Tax=Artomyces pyxidatus TaxID=48021 RepID=A0ACB8SD01_9AGAM|nr:hypothetical protein BV25DRAFT_1922799 [Artomyces pyxidatus]
MDLHGTESSILYAHARELSPFFIDTEVQPDGDVIFPPFHPPITGDQEQHGYSSSSWDLPVLSLFESSSSAHSVLNHQEEFFQYSLAKSGHASHDNHARLTEMFLSVFSWRASDFTGKDSTSSPTSEQETNLEQRKTKRNQSNYILRTERERYESHLQDDFNDVFQPSGCVLCNKGRSFSPSSSSLLAKIDDISVVPPTNISANSTRLRPDGTFNDGSAIVSHLVFSTFIIPV